MCSEGAIGPMCGACAEGWFFVGQECAPCDSGAILETLSTFALGFGVGLFIFLMIKYDGVPVPEHLIYGYGFPDRLQLPLVGAIKMMDPGALKVIWVTLQIIMSVGWNLDMTFPPPFSSFLGQMSFMELSFINADCNEGSNFHNRVYLNSLFPALMVVGVWVAFFIRMKLAKEDAKRIKELFTFHCYLALMVTYCFLPA